MRTSETKTSSHKWLDDGIVTWMDLTEAQYERVASLLPVQRGNVRVSNLRVLSPPVCSRT